ncbi:MAG: hypothetical protein NTU43_04985 [Bacteroidetes bacterium]|nr:hypothetical protein [Bacteroidota bacterium]
MRIAFLYTIFIILLSSCGNEGVVYFISTDIDKMLGEQVEEQINNNPEQFN